MNREPARSSLNLIQAYSEKIIKQLLQKHESFDEMASEFNNILKQLDNAKPTEAGGIELIQKIVVETEAK